MNARSVPVWSVVLSGGLAAILAFLLDIVVLTDFVSMVSIESSHGAAACVRPLLEDSISSNKPPLPMNAMNFLDK